MTLQNLFYYNVKEYKKYANLCKIVIKYTKLCKNVKNLFYGNYQKNKSYSIFANQPQTKLKCANNPFKTGFTKFE